MTNRFIKAGYISLSVLVIWLAAVLVLPTGSVAYLSKSVHTDVTAGTTTYVVSFAGGMQPTDDIEVWVNGTKATSATVTWLSGSTLQLNGYTPVEGDDIEFRRVSPKDDNLVDLEAGKTIRAVSLMKNFRHTLQVAQEAWDKSDADSAAAEAAAYAAEAAISADIIEPTKFAYNVDSVEALRLTPATEYTTVYLRGHTSVGDGGQGTFRWDATSTTADDNGVTIAVTGVATGRWVRQLSGFVTPEMFGGVSGSDITAELVSMATIAGELRFSGDYVVTGQTTLSSNTYVKGLPGSSIEYQGNMTAKSIFCATGKSNISVEGLELFSDETGNAGDFSAAIYFNGCSNFIIEKNYIHDMNTYGVIVLNGVDFKVQKNTIKNINDPTAPSEAIALRDNCVRFWVSENTIDNIGHNDTYGLGIFIVHFNAGADFAENFTVESNKVSNIYGHGICVYNSTVGFNPDLGDSRIINNTVRNTGLSSTSGLGNGIYLQFCSADVINNKVYSSCKNTIAGAIGQGAIVASGRDNTFPQPSMQIIGNFIDDTGNFNGIRVQYHKNINISSNTILNSKNGDAAIRLSGSQWFNIFGNTIESDNTQIAGVYLKGDVDPNTNGTVSNNTLKSCYRGIYSIGSKQVNYHGNIINNVIAAISLSGDQNCSVEGNKTLSTTANSLSLTGCSNVVAKNNPFARSGVGDWVLVSIDATSSGAGCYVYSSGSTYPGSGTWSVGSYIKRTNPSIGVAKGWYCTVAGTPGTWVSEGAL